jgi:uncharacterized protein YuzE
VRISYDRDANAAYIHLAEPPHRGRLVGIEILDADIILP